MRDSSEPAFITITNITLANATDTFIATTNDSGFYSLGINEGIYDVSLESISPYWAESACNPAVITLPLNADTIVSFGYNAILQSPYIVMSAETRIPLFMPHAFVYTLEYKNIGTDVFTGYIEVELDTNLVVDSASVAWTAQNGNTFTFPVQNLGVMQKETLKIFYHPIINLDLIDRTLCFNAHAYSDTVYSVSPLWDQSDLQMMAVYNAAADSVEFTLKNKGAGDMNIPQEMIVIEDNVILVKEAVQLPAGAEIIRKLKANGATWRATVPQTDFNPYSKFTTAAIEAAGTNDIGAFSTGFINQFPVNGFYGFDYTLCALVTASYDPNAKYVLPEGAGSNHLIDSTTELEYTITFQNTGTDTAYTVRLVDTLASYLNPASIKVGVASHKFEMNFLSSNVIEFLFNNIYLPDSATDETGSQGFVKFKIKQRENNANGTVINNNAAIYFDYNTPVITNTATVQIGELTFTGIENLYAEKEVHISAYPNPFTEQATILVEGENFREMQLTVYDINGRKVKQQKAFNTNRFTIDRSGFGNGIYFFEISSEGKIIGRGKVIAN